MFLQWVLVELSVSRLLKGIVYPEMTAVSSFLSLMLFQISMTLQVHLNKLECRRKS